MLNYKAKGIIELFAFIVSYNAKALEHENWKDLYT